MLLPVVPQMTTRAQRGQIRRVVVSGILIQMGASQDCFHQPPFRPIRLRANAERAALIVVPLVGFRIQPTAVFDHQDDLTVRTAAPFAATSGPLELDVIRQLSPVGRVQGAKIGMDGHGLFILALCTYL